MTTTFSPLQCFRASNLLTFASLAAGLVAIGCAAGGNADAAGALIAAAVVFDTFDGRFARLFRRNDFQKAIGVQLDSLSDAIAFGLAPSVCAALILWRPGHAAATGIQEALWSISALAFAASAVARLAFYNVTSDRIDGFVGLPAPVAALVWATILLLQPGIALSAVVLSVMAAAMVLPLRIPRPSGLAFAAFVCWPLIVIAGHVARST